MISGTGERHRSRGREVEAERINGSWRVRFKKAGHGQIYQYPDRLAKVVTDLIELSPIPAALDLDR